jgi:hypothetical protein
MERFTRAEFLAERWAYRPGEHVSLICPTQNGKTTMIWDLLKATDTSWCRRPPVMLVAKPRDPVVGRGLAALEYEEISAWPPRKKLFKDPPPGYGLWPKHLTDAPPEVNDAHLAGKFRPAVNELFWGGNSVLVADEQYHLCAVLGLQAEMTRHWTQGAGMGAGLWSATQKPSGTQQGTIPSFMYSSPTHTFLGRDPDERNRKRFGEIGGVSPKLVENHVANLRRFEWLYIHRDGPTMCVVEAF